MSLTSSSPPRHSRRAARPRVLLVSLGATGARLGGPEMRAWAIATVLSDTCDVTVLARSAPVRGVPSVVDVEPLTRRSLVIQSRRHDVLIAPWIHPFTFLLTRRARLISDLYDPVEFEMTQTPGGPAREAAAASHLTSLQLAFADALCCGSEAQAQRLIELAGSARGDGKPPPVVIAPFGVPAAQPRRARGLIRNRFPHVNVSDVLVVWWGSVWSWLDAQTAIEAMQYVVKHRDDVKLVICAGEPPPSRARSAGDVDHLKEFASARGLLGQSVFFYDSWIPYGDRDLFLAEADIGITLDRPGSESRLAVRARYLDYLWCGVPCILSGDDDFGRALVNAELALPVPQQAPEAVANAIMRLASNAGERARRREASRPLARELEWPSVLRPLVDLVHDRPQERPLRGRPYRAVARYYIRRLSDIIGGRIDRR